MKGLVYTLLIIPLGFLWSLNATAEDKPLTFDRVELSASAQGEAANDILVAILFRELEGPSAAPLADEVNQSTSEAIARLKEIPEIRVQTLNYQTVPVYQKGRVTGWRVRQSLQLETKDIAKLSSLLGELQERLSLESIHYNVSPETIKAVEDRLISEALKAFQQRAELVTRELGRSRYRIVFAHLETSGPPVQPRFIATQSTAMEAVTAPVIEAGTQKTIELQTN
jgi:predicted secreted protein